jgi:hypothetical protein
MVAEGATMCKVCKALYDMDKKKAKAKAKAKLKKAKEGILKDETVQAVIEDLFKGVVDVLEEKYGREKMKKAVITATIAHMLNQTLPTNDLDLEANRSLMVSGKDTATGCEYLVHPA